MIGSDADNRAFALKLGIAPDPGMSRYSAEAATIEPSHNGYIHSSSVGLFRLGFAWALFSTLCLGSL
jgi:hypothetical protein